MRKRNMMMAAGLAATLAGCGGGGSITTPPTPTTTTTLRPQPSPTPSPEATPCPDGSCGNHKEVVRASLRLYLLFDQNRVVVNPTPDPVKQVLEQPLPVGYIMRLDVSGKDENGDETDGKGQIQWFYSGQDLVDTDARTPWQRDVTIVKPGQWSVYVNFDGVDSNSIAFTFKVFQ
jgi:hypothetical protein